MECIWDGKLVKSSKDSVYLRALIHQDQQWELSHHLSSISLSEHTLLFIQAVFDITQGLHRPFLLVKHAATSKYQLFECNFENKNLQQKHTFDCSQPASFCALDGPTIILCHESALVRIETCNTTAPLTVHLPKLLRKTVRIGKWWAFNWCQDSILLMLQLSSSESSSVHWANIVVSRTGQVSQSVDYVPYEYGCIATFIGCHDYVTVSDVTGEYECRRRFVVGTDFKQVIVFEEGALLYCVSLNEPPSEVVVLESSKQSLSLASLCEGGSCVAYKLCDSTLKECGRWSDVSDVLVGDFNGSGQHQLLMIKNNASSGDKDFIVTDLTSFSAEDQMDVSESKGSTSSLSDTLKAYQLRKHEAEVQLTRLECELQRKALLIQSSLCLLNSLGNCSGAETEAAPQDANMLCIVPGVVTSNHDNIRPPSVIKTEYVWSRVIDGEWVVGLVLRNITKHRLSELHCSTLLPHLDTPTQSHSKIVWDDSLNKPSVSDDSFLTEVGSASKRRKMEETLGAKLRTSDLTVLEPRQELCCVCSVLLPLSWGHERSLNGVVVVTVSVNDRQIVHDVPVSLSLNEALSEEVKIQQSCLQLWKGEGILREMNWSDRGYQDLASLLAIRKTSQLNLSTSCSVLTSWDHMFSILTRRLPLSRPHALKMVPTNPSSIHFSSTARTSTGNSSSNCSASESEVLHGVAVCVCPSSSQTTGVINVMYRSECQLSTLLATLKQVLPINISLSASDSV